MHTKLPKICVTLLLIFCLATPAGAANITGASSKLMFDQITGEVIFPSDDTATLVSSGMTPRGYEETFHINIKGNGSHYLLGRFTANGFTDISVSGTWGPAYQTVNFYVEHEVTGAKSHCSMKSGSSGAMVATQSGSCILWAFVPNGEASISGTINIVYS